MSWLERLLSIQKTSSTSKSMAGATKDAAPKDFTLIGAPMLLPGLMQLLGKSGLADMVPMGVNVVISNTQGPPFPLYCAGAKVTALYPVSIPTHGVGLNLTVQSYMNALDFGVTADRKAVPDVADLADGLKPALDELVAAVKAKMPAGEAVSDAKAAPKVAASNGASALPAKAQSAKTGSKATVAAKGGAPAAKAKATKGKAQPAKTKPAAAKTSAAKAPAAKTPAAKATRTRATAR
ncbi:MAG: WSD1 family O-acyltransferase [Proteobacteria bacterium]|nr:WSD1 family O-acyltransferase [Pseudomonadota bacterium]